MIFKSPVAVGFVSYDTIPNDMARPQTIPYLINYPEEPHIPNHTIGQRLIRKLAAWWSIWAEKSR